MKINFAMALALGLGAASPALADSQASFAQFTRHFLGKDIGLGSNYACFARFYDLAHLAAHPRQNVRDMELLATVDSKDRSYYALQLGLQFRKGKQHRTTSADCRARDEGPGSATEVECCAACEGGTVDIKLQENGSVLLTFPNNGGIWSPNERGDIVISPPASAPTTRYSAWIAPRAKNAFRWSTTRPNPPRWPRCAEGDRLGTAQPVQGGHARRAIRHRRPSRQGRRGARDEGRLSPLRRR